MEQSNLFFFYTKHSKGFKLPKDELFMRNNYETTTALVNHNLSARQLLVKVLEHGILCKEAMLTNREKAFAEIIADDLRD